jgi:hypothetical protein
MVVQVKICSWLISNYSIKIPYSVAAFAAKPDLGQSTLPREQLEKADAGEC